MCNKCQQYGGMWQMTHSGLKRCDCGVNPKLAAVDRDRKNGTQRVPVIDVTAAVGILKMFSGVMTFVPRDPVAVSAIADEVRSICESNASALWLVKRMGQLFKQWPGVRDMRMVYSSKYRPLDGIEIEGTSEAYPDGVPSERQLEAPPALALPPGKVSTAESINDTMEALVEAKSMKYARRHVPVPDIPILPPGQRVSQADIDAALDALREKRARNELTEETE